MMTRLNELPLLPVYRGEQIREAERPLIAEGRGEELMRRASYGLADCVVKLLRQRGRVYGSTVTALVGSGNNGADALCALTSLRRRGAAVRAVLVRDRAHQAALAAFERAGGDVVQAVSETTDVLIDAVVGTGFSGEYQRPDAAGLAAALESAVVVACDLPSGVDADTGRAGAGVISAEHTVTFGGIKQGLLVGAGGHLSGRLHTVDIGLRPHLPRTPVRAAAPHPDAGAAGAARSESLRAPASTDHKYSRGTVRIHAGSAQFPGAAQLSVGAAVATGVGMVTLVAPETVRSHVVAAWPETLGVEPDQQASRSRADAVVIGPGLGNDPRRLGEAETALEQCLDDGSPCVLDASGLQLIRHQLHHRGELGHNVLITPHLGEARRIAEDLRDQVAGRMLATDGTKSDPVEAARRLSGSLDCFVLLKGATTIIAAPDGEVLLHRAQTRGRPGVPGLATAGTGDVLCGVLGALAATQQGSWLTVAVLGVHRHAQAAAGLDPRAEASFGASALVRALSRSPVAP
ncbi:MAG: NAD(P)H-hydrate dehydratase [Nesterenkonia sp.]